MLTARAARCRLSLGCLLALTSGVAASATAVAGPASADSVRDGQQWVLDAVDAPAAWPVSQGQGVTVAVIDSGVNPEVSDLVGSVTTGPDYSGVSTPSSNPEWGMHGTWMASLIAGHGHGFESGISGVAPKARVLSIRVLPDKKDPAYKQYEHEPASNGQRALAKAITYAVGHRVRVISMSLGYGSASKVVRSALQYAYQRKVVVVASAGNSGNRASDRAQAHAPYSYPADYPGVLAVAAVNKAGNPAYFSSDNLSVQVAAPGVRVLAQGNNGQYWLVNGTSPACALAAGVAALIKAVHPRMAPALVVRAIEASAQHPPGGYNDRVGFGTVDAVAALTAANRLAKYVPAGRGIAASTHFGGGSAAIPPPPIRTRGLEQLVLFCLLAAACLALTVIAASRLVLARAQGAGPGGPVLAMARSAVSEPYTTESYTTESYTTESYTTESYTTGPHAVGPYAAGPYAAGEDQTGPDGPGPDRAALDAAGSDGAALDAAGRDGAALDAAGPDGATLDAAGSDGAALEGAELAGAGPYASGQGGTETDGTAPDGTVTDGTVTDGTAPDGTVTDGTAADGTTPDEAGLAGTGPYAAGKDAVSMNGAVQDASPSNGAAKDSGDPPGHAPSVQQPDTGGWSWYRYQGRDAATSDEEATSEQSQPGQADGE
jgi:type VII secretion-associated serine protease mycosin